MLGSAASFPAFRRRWFLIGLVAFFLVLNVRVLLKVQFSSRESRSAIIRWMPQLQQLQEGTDIWRRHNYPNPPIMAMILMPFAQFPEGVGALAWFYCKVAMTILAIHWLFRLLDQPERPFPTWGKMLAVLLSLRPIQGDLTHGNVNLFILFLIVACLVAFTHRRDWLAGLTLALAIACKITPALFVPYFLWKRAWTALAATAVGLGLFLFVLPGLTFGWQDNWTYLQSWQKVMVQPFAEGTITSEHQNQSLPGLMARMLTRAPSFADYDGDAYVPVAFHNLADIERTTLQWLLKGCMALFALVVLWRCRAPIHDRTDWRLFAEYAVVAVGMLIFSERTWKHHAVTLVLPFAVLCYLLSAFELSRGQRRTVIGALVFSSLAMLSTSTGFWDTHDLIGKTAQVYGAYVWAFLALAAALFCACRWQPVARKHRDGRDEAPYPDNHSGCRPATSSSQAA
jgi:hypothetical protein